MKIRHLSLCLILLVTGSLFSSQVRAQEALNKILTQLEQSELVDVSVICKRDPDTRKVIKIIKTVTIPAGKEGDKMLEKIFQAFEKEKENAIEVINNKKGKKYDSILQKYQKDGMAYMYSLSGRVFSLIGKTADKKGKK
ncbi:DUF5024 domain-containing protein [Barnesiella propionica]|uniref:DUF5024 domain-containing protein n=1 Tax=Barnesiella propionica TaxID=2981781 RepID=UPI0011CC65D7|nr:DUF5024 domain-containing protein [Barnesiella propionica]MCU6768836.1 DUF5024 domain-containing protein [Barnesiella propionica]